MKGKQYAFQKPSMTQTVLPLSINEDQRTKIFSGRNLIDPWFLKHVSYDKLIMEDFRLENSKELGCLSQL